MKDFFTNPVKKRQLLLLTVDGAVVILAFLTGYALRISLIENNPLHRVLERPTWILLAAVALHLITLYVFEMYDLEKNRSAPRVLILIVFSVGIATILLAFLSYLDPENKLGRVVLAIHIPLTTGALFFWRKAYLSVSQRFLSENRVLLLGESPINQEIMTLLRSMGSPVAKAYRPVREIVDYHENPGVEEVAKEDSQALSLGELVRKDNVNTIVIAKDLKEQPRLRADLVKLRFDGLSIYEAPVFYKKIAGKVPVFHIQDGWFIFNEKEGLFDTSYYFKLKRVTDIALSSVALLGVAPLMLLCAAAIKLNSRGPVFFRQERLGLNEKPYMLIKFRTMVDNAEKATGPKWSSREDPRITKVGRFLRKTRLDELPQFFNVLKGDMSFVGPRPIRKHFADLLAEEVPYYRIRFLVKPGITGWAQVKYDYAGSEEGQMEKLQYELFYIQNQSIFFDIYIILKTVQTVLFRPGE